MTLSIADLCDQYEEQVSVAQSLFQNFGATEQFHGKIFTLKVDRDFLLIKQTLSSAGNNQVLVIDGDASMDCALLGDRLAAMAHNNQWSGIVINGCVRDVAELRNITIGIRALATCPRKPGLEGGGSKNVPLHFAGLTFTPGDYLYADTDGIIVAAKELS